MQTKLNPYLNFKDKTREAMEFYKSVFGGQLNMQTFKDFHASQDPSEDNLIMHAQLDGENGLTLMAADVPNRMPYQSGTNISIALSGDDEPQMTNYFNKLSTGGKISQPLVKSAWGDTFGMVTDRYGTNWLVNIAGKKG